MTLFKLDFFNSKDFFLIFFVVFDFLCDFLFTKKIFNRIVTRADTIGWYFLFSAAQVTAFP